MTRPAAVTWKIRQPHRHLQSRHFRPDARRSLRPCQRANAGQKDAVGHRPGRSPFSVIFNPVRNPVRSTTAASGYLRPTNLAMDADLSVTAWT